MPKPRVMAVDDDALMIETLMSHLKRDGYPVVYAQSGEEALHLLGEGEPPDLIFLDMNMPGMDGFEFYKKLQTDPKNKSIPVVMLSAFAQDKDKELIKKLGVRRFVDKAEATPDKLVEIVTEECKKPEASAH